jgi:hypothetical protein
MPTLFRIAASSLAALVTLADAQACPIEAAAYEPVGRAGEGWRIEFARLEESHVVAIVSGPFEGSPVDLRASFGKLGGWPYHLGQAPAIFFNEALESARPYGTAPHYMIVHRLDAHVAYVALDRMTVGLGEPMWRLEGCGENSR